MAKVLALIDGKKVEVELFTCCPVKFVILQEPNGNDRAVDPRSVEQVQRQSATRSRLRLKNTGSVTVQGTVADVVAALEA